MREPGSLLTLAILLILPGHTYATDVAACGRVYVIHQSTLVLVSPGNYTGYPTNMNCVWLYQADPSDVLMWNMYDIAVDCGDGVSAFDGNTPSATALQSDLCTTGSPFSIPIHLTTGRYLTVEFKTDTQSPPNERGFFTRVISASDQSQCPISGTEVNLTATLLPRVITSPNFPNQYSSDYRCQWTITAGDPTRTIKVQFHFLDVQENLAGQCFDNITFYEDGSIVKEICGQDFFAPDTDTAFMSSGNQVTIVFNTDSTVVRRGFKLSYQQGDQITTTTNPTTTTMSTTTQTTTEVTTPTTMSTTAETTTTTELTTPTSVNTTTETTTEKITPTTMSTTSETTTAEVTTPTTMSTTTKTTTEVTTPTTLNTTTETTTEMTTPTTMNTTTETTTEITTPVTMSTTPETTTTEVTTPTTMNTTTETTTELTTPTTMNTTTETTTAEVTTTTTMNTTTETTTELTTSTTMSTTAETTTAEVTTPTTINTTTETTAETMTSTTINTTTETATTEVTTPTTMITTIETTTEMATSTTMTTTPETSTTNITLPTTVNVTSTTPMTPSADEVTMVSLKKSCTTTKATTKPPHPPKKHSYPYACYVKHTKTLLACTSYARVKRSYHKELKAHECWIKTEDSHGTWYKNWSFGCLHSCNTCPLWRKNLDWHKLYDFLSSSKHWELLHK